LIAMSAKPMNGHGRLRPARKNCFADARRRLTHPDTPNSRAKKTPITT